MLIPDKIINSDFFRHFHQCNVTGIGNRIHCAFHSMSRTKMTSDIIISHMKITTTIIRFLSGKSSCLQSGCNSEWFHRRPRFKCITDTEISPDTTQYVQLILLIYRIPFFFGINTGQISWFVQIKIRVRGLSQNFSGIRIHDHNRCILATGHSTSFFSGMFFIELLNVFFHNTL